MSDEKPNEQKDEPRTTPPAAKKRRKSPNAPLTIGEVVHRHERENSDWEKIFVPCHAVEYKVKSRQGLKINERLFVGKAVVPQCVADYLSYMDLQHQKNEESIHTNRGRAVDLGEIRN